MSGHFKIRVAVETDVDTIYNLIKELAQFEKLSHEVVATKQQLQKTLFGEKKYAEVLIGEYESKPIAFALFFHNYSTFLSKPGIYLEDLYVKQEHRSKGFGAQFFERLIQIANVRNCGRVEWSVLRWNKKAIAFYERLGARPLEDWTTYRLNL